MEISLIKLIIMRKIILFSILISSLLIPVNGQGIISELDSVILNSFDQDGPGVTVLIKHKGEVIYHKGTSKNRMLI